jgi:CO/xanthine dehydrogenase FAD-binding subunit
MGRVIPRPFEYERAASVGEAVAILAGANGRDAKVIAGGQSLVPMLSLGLVRPDLVVDISRLELDAVEANGDRIRVGAMTRHRTLELDPDVRRALPLAAEAARHIGNPRVRNRGTFGGSLVHADPAAELPVVALAHGGEVVTEGPGGTRRIALDEFFLGYLETALAPDEVLVAVELDALPEDGGVGFHEEAQRADDFALACAAAVVDADGAARVVVGGVGDRPLRFDGGVDELPEKVESGVEPEEDAFVSAEFRRRLAGICARRALARAQGAAAA